MGRKQRGGFHKKTNKKTPKRVKRKKKTACKNQFFIRPSGDCGEVQPAARRAVRPRHDAQRNSLEPPAVHSYRLLHRSPGVSRPEVNFQPS